MNKKQILSKDKVITHYTDVNSVVLKNYIDISQQRLNKVRAGFHLDTVLSHQPNNSMYRPNTRAMTAGYFNTEQSNQEQNNPRRNGGLKSPNQDLPLSEFMDNYVSKKNVDEELLVTKEDNIQGYFKEKYTLMGKYLGEDILQKGLLKNSPKFEGRNFTAVEKYRKTNKNNKNLDSDLREKHLMDLLKEGDDEGAPNSKVLQINREIMGQILQEEHQEEMEELHRLQTEQNLQLFNDLQDVDEKAEVRKTTNLATSGSELPGKVFLKTNFIRTSVETKTQTDLPEYFQPPPVYPQHKPQTAAVNWDRPKTDNILLRTNKGKESLFPNVDKISNVLDANKFGARNLKKSPEPNLRPHQTPNNYRANLPQTAPAENQRARTTTAATRFRLSNLKIETNGQGLLESSNRNEAIPDKTNKNDMNIPILNASSSTKHLSEVINEGIEFLRRQKSPEEYKSETASERYRTIKQNTRFAFVPFRPENTDQGFGSMVASQSSGNIKENMKQPVNKVSQKKKGLTIAIGQANKPQDAAMSMSVGGKKLFKPARGELPMTQKAASTLPQEDFESMLNSAKGKLSVRNQTRNFYTRYFNARKPQDMKGVGLQGKSTQIEPFVTKLISMDYQQVSMEPYQEVMAYGGTSKSTGMFNLNLENLNGNNRQSRGEGKEQPGQRAKTSYNDKFWVHKF